MVILLLTHYLFKIIISILVLFFCFIQQQNQYLMLNVQIYLMTDNWDTSYKSLMTDNWDTSPVQIYLMIDNWETLPVHLVIDNQDTYTNLSWQITKILHLYKSISLGSCSTFVTAPFVSPLLSAAFDFSFSLVLLLVLIDTYCDFVITLTKGTFSVTI